MNLLASLVHLPVALHEHRRFGRRAAQAAISPAGPVNAMRALEKRVWRGGGAPGAALKAFARGVADAGHRPAHAYEHQVRAGL